MSKIIRKELSLINKKIDALRDEYRKKIKAFASDSNTTSADLEEIYVEHLISYTDEDKYGELIDVWYVDHNLEWIFHFILPPVSLSAFHFFESQTSI